MIIVSLSMQGQFPVCKLGTRILKHRCISVY
uniref:Uncharacterized protein n=1 Tax=Arundo donax TaxID=35708 RepID=A0A0A9H0H8_ARUDO